MRVKIDAKRNECIHITVIANAHTVFDADVSSITTNVIQDLRELQEYASKYVLERLDVNHVVETYEIPDEYAYLVDFLVDDLKSLPPC